MEGQDASLRDAGAPARDAGPRPDARPPDSGALDGGEDAGARPDAGSGPDAGPPRFEPPALIMEFSDLTADDPTLRGDLLEIFFNQGADIYTATRTDAARMWGAATPVDELNSIGTDTSPELSTDGRTIYFASSRGGNLDIWMSTRPDLAAGWSPPVRVPELSSSMLDTNPTMTPDGLRLVLSRGDTSVTRSIYESTRGSVTDAWDSPVLRAELSRTPNDAAAMLASRATFVVYHSDAPGGAGGSRSLFYARRLPGESGFGPPVRIDELDSDGDEEDPWISEDERYLVFTRDSRLYETRR
jgi:hypothetical protein